MAIRFKDANWRRAAAGLLVLMGGITAVNFVSKSSPKSSTPANFVPVLITPPALDLSHIDDPDPVAIEAIEAARAEVSRAPRHADAWGRLGMILLAQGVLSGEANTCFAQAERLHPSDARWSFYQGNSLLESDPDAAIAHLTRTAELSWEQPETARMKLAETLLSRGRLDEAEGHFRKLLAAHPKHPRAHVALARVALARGDPEKARSDIAVALADSRTAKSARSLLAEISFRAGEREKASMLAAEASSLPDDPPWPDPYMEAVERMEVGRKQNLSVAMGLMRAGRLTESIRLLRDTRREYPDSERVLLLLGMAHNMTKAWVQGEKVLREAAAVAPDAPRVHFNLGISLASQSRWEEAAACFEKATRFMPDDAIAHFRLGDCQTQLGHTDRAEAAYRRALSCRPNFGDVHRQLGQVLLKRGRRADGLLHLRIAIALNPRDKAAMELIQNDQTEGAAVPVP